MVVLGPLADQEPPILGVPQALTDDDLDWIRGQLAAVGIEARVWREVNIEPDIWMTTEAIR